MLEAGRVCKLALSIFPQHSSAVELQAQLNTAMVTERAITTGAAQLTEGQYAAASASFATAVQNLEKENRAGNLPRQGQSGYEETQLCFATCYSNLAVCDRNQFSPAPSAEAMYTKAIGCISLLQVPTGLEACIRDRLFVRCDHGNTEDALEDIAACKKLGLSLEMEWQDRMLDVPLLRTMACGAKGAVVDVELFLNERWVPLRGWSSGHLFGSDRDMFTHAFGNPHPGYRGERHGTPAVDAVILPAGWVWADDDWTSSIGRPGFDKDGFQYSTCWEPGYGYKPKNSTLTCVRRRRLIRQARKVLPKPEVDAWVNQKLLHCGYVAKAGGGMSTDFKMRWFELRRGDPTKPSPADEVVLCYFEFDHERGSVQKQKGQVLMSKVLEIMTSVGSKIDLITEARVYHLLSERETFAGWVYALRLAYEMTRETSREGAATVAEGIPPKPGKEPEPEPELER